MRGPLTGYIKKMTEVRESVERYTQSYQLKLQQLFSGLNLRSVDLILRGEAGSFPWRRYTC